MSLPRDRLAMFHSHLKDRSESERTPEFPMLMRHERLQFINSNFHSNPSTVGSQISKYPSMSLNPTSSNSTQSLSTSEAILPKRRRSQQPDHKLVMIPGPVEFSDGVLESMSTPSQAHTSPEFIETFSGVLSKLRLIFGNNKETNGGQTLVISGSGTLGWDILGSNLINSSSDNILCISTGFFSNGLAECLTNYVDDEFRQITKLEADVGECVPIELIREELLKKKYSLITLTHTDTSTGVLTNIKEISEVVKSVSPQTLIAVDAVCSAGVEEIQVDNWGLDFVLTASQKALSTPAGLSILFISQRAIDMALKTRKKKPFYTSLNKWLPIMINYENKKPSYFATPSVQLISALEISLLEILGSDSPQIDPITKLPISLLDRIKKHRIAANRLRNKLISEETKLKSVSRLENACNGMTALYVPSNIETSKLLSHLSQKYNINLAGSIHPKINSKYIRIGHMGVSVIEENGIELDRVIEAVKLSLKEFQ